MGSVGYLGLLDLTVLASRQMIIFLILVVAALVIFYWRVYRMERRRLTPGQRRILWILRVLVAVLVVAMLARPARDYVREEERPPVAAIVMDESMSMDFPGELTNDLIRGNPRDERTRYDGAKNALQILQKPLAVTHRVKVFTASDALRHVKDVAMRDDSDAPVESLQAILGKAIKPSGTYSNVGDGLERIIDSLQEYRVSGVIVLSDGRVTGGRTLAEAAAKLAAASIPVHTVTFGADHPLRDLRIDEVNVPVEASLGDLLTFNLTLTNYVRHNLKVDLRLLEGEPGKEPKEVRRQRVTWTKMGQKKVSVFTIPNVEGEREFQIVLPVYEGEINADNNQQRVTVKVIKRGLRLLLIAGRPTLEYHYLVPALLRDPIVKLSCFLQSSDVDYIHQGNAGIDRLPRTTSEWNEFDVVILADPDPKQLESRQIAGLEALVSKGGGLLVLAGRCFGLDMLLQVHPTKMGEMLPVQIDKNDHPDYATLFTNEIKTVRTTIGRRHPVMIAAADTRVNERIWSTFPTIYWHHPVMEAKRESVVLLDRAGADGNPSGTALMAIRRYQRGAVFYSGLNSLWRWRYPAESYDYDRFWTGVIRYLGQTRLTGTQKQVALSTDKRVYSPGELVTIYLRVLDPALMEQLRNDRVFVTVTGAGGQSLSVPLRPDPVMPEYRGEYDARHLGQTVVHARHVSSKADSAGEPLFDVKHRFDVKLRSLEELDTSADLDGMRELAEETGGTYLDYRTVGTEALEKMAAEIPTEKQILTEHRVIEVWDGLMALIPFLVLVSVEWSLRKLWGVL